MNSVLNFICTLLFLSLSFANLRAQNNLKLDNNTYRNSLKLAWGDYFIRRTSHLPTPASQVGIFYERKASRNWHIGLGFMEWNNIWSGVAPFLDRYTYGNGKVQLQEENSQAISSDEKKPYSPAVNNLETRFRYKMLDLYALYTFKIPRSHHYLSAGIGVSNSWGTNSYVSFFYYTSMPASPTGKELVIGYDNKTEKYLGVIPQISYDFHFFKERFLIGGTYRARYYPERIKIQHDLEFHTGINF